MRLVDLTHSFTQEMPAFPGDPPAALLQCGEMQGCPLYEVHTGMHVGTHMDAPLHFLPDGARISELPPERFIGRGVLLDARGSETIDAALLSGVDLQSGDIVLVFTGWSRRFREPDYYRNYPVLSEAFAAALVKAGVSIVGFDTPSPDRSPYALHSILLSGGVLIVENLTNLEALLTVQRFDVIALPVKFEAEAAAARVIARV